MKKRSKKRIPQDILPWKRVIKRNEIELSFFRKKTTRWTSGQSRNWQMNLFNQQNCRELINNNLKSFLLDQRLFFENILYKAQLQYKLNKINKKSLRFKPKNFCLISGKNRTYNQMLYITRQTLRMLSRAGAVVGLIK